MQACEGKPHPSPLPFPRRSASSLTARGSFFRVCDGFQDWLFSDEVVICCTMCCQGQNSTVRSALARFVFLRDYAALERLPSFVKSRSVNISCTSLLSESWHEVLLRDRPIDQVVLVGLHAGQGSMGGSRHILHVRPEGHVLELIALDLVDVASVLHADRGGGPPCRSSRPSTGNHEPLARCSLDGQATPQRCSSEGSGWSFITL